MDNVADFMNAGGADNPCPITLDNEFWMDRLAALTSLSRMRRDKIEELEEQLKEAKTAAPKKKAAAKKKRGRPPKKKSV